LEGGVYWNQLLRPLGVPLPSIVAASLEPSEIEFPFVVLEQLPGTDLGEVYQTLTSPEKLGIVSEVVRIREKVSVLPEAGGFGFACSYSEPPALVEQGRLSGVVDVDQLCFGDPLLTVGLTQTALLAAGFDVDYVQHWMDLLSLNKQLRQVVDAYTLLFCVDFMSELGQRFNKEDQAEIDLEKFARLESILETLAH
jgi:hypothetical protein